MRDWHTHIAEAMRPFQGNNMSSTEINKIVRSSYPNERNKKVPIFDHYITEDGTAYCSFCNDPSKAIFEKVNKQLYHVRRVDGLTETSQPDREVSFTSLDAPDALEIGRAFTSTDANIATYDPTNAAEARLATMRAIKVRRGQQGFRRALVEAYGGRCTITGCDVLDVLEAAHITAYLGPKTNHVTNGLLLRADLHTLFDCGLLAVDPATLKVVVAPTLRQSDYGALHGRPLSSPQDPASTPSGLALLQHLTESGIGTGA